MTDDEYMLCALSLALKGAGRTNPNPLVGAVIVKNGRIIGKGCHMEYGGLHAERNALASCTEPAEGSTLYVTLEPCCHYGKQPPCTDAIIASGITRVVVGSADPNRLVNGKGIEMLRLHGIRVDEGISRQACDAINKPFFHYIRYNTPYVILKYAMTMDGRISYAEGKGCTLTGSSAHDRVHADRNRYAAVMTGIGTILTDDPHLTCRKEDGRNPLRIICDTNLRIPYDAFVVQTADSIPTLIATCSSDTGKKDALMRKGCTIIQADCNKEGHICLSSLMKKLGQMQIDSIILECGPLLAADALRSGIVSMIQCYIAPFVCGGHGAPVPADGAPLASPSQMIKLGRPEITPYGDDILIESEVLPCSQE